MSAASVVTVMSIRGGTGQNKTLAQPRPPLSASQPELLGEA